LGIIHDVVSSHEDLLTVSRLWALDIAEGRISRTHTLQRTDKIEPIHESSAILEVKRQQVLKTSPHYKACLDVIEEGIISGGYAGVLKVRLKTHNIKFFLSMQKLVARNMQVDQVYVLSHFYHPLLSMEPITPL